MALFRRTAAEDSEMPVLLIRAGENVERVSVLLRDLLTEYPEHAELVADVQRCEHEGDRIAHDIIRRISINGHSRMPFSPGDGHALATALDDIVDFAEETADALGVYGVEAPMEQAVGLAEVLVEASAHVARALVALTDDDDQALQPTLSEIHRLESQGDRLLREALASLFANGIDPMLVIRWKDIFESLESSIDACQTVANVVEGIALKRGRH